LRYGEAVTSFRYRALNQAGEVISGSISAPTVAEVIRQVEYLGLVPIEAVNDAGWTSASKLNFAFLNKPRSEDITIFTRDLALLLKAGARLDAALELLSDDLDIGRLRPIINEVRSGILGGESLAEAISHHRGVFPDVYVALVRVGEAAGTLDHVLEVLAAERERGETLRRKLAEAARYPAFVLLAAGCVLTFFLLFVLPQFAAVLRGFQAHLDPIVSFFLGLSDFVRSHGSAIAIVIVIALATAWLVAGRTEVRRAAWNTMARLPLLRSLLMFHTTGMFCRNLGLLLSNGMTLSAALRILVDLLDHRGQPEAWARVAGHVRQGGKLSDALAEAKALPATAVRMLKLGEETGQLAALSSRIAEFYEAKLQRSVDRIIGIAGPAAIVGISVLVGGLIVSVMTSLLSVSQIVAS
jgi:general secretion pathway protein F